MVKRRVEASPLPAPRVPADGMGRSMHARNGALRRACAGLAPVLALALVLPACNGTGPTAPTSPAAGSTAAPAGQRSGRQPHEISQAWIRAPLPSAGIAGGYLQLHNPGTADDRLVAIRSDAIERVEIHGMRQEDGVLRMRPYPEGVALPAGETVAFVPGGNHLMLIHPGESVVAGAQVTATLTFAHAAEQPVVFDVRDSVEEDDADAPEAGPQAAEEEGVVPDADAAESADSIP